MEGQQRPLPVVIDLGSDDSDNDNSVIEVGASHASGSDVSPLAGERDTTSHAADDFADSFLTTLDRICCENAGTFAHSASIGKDVFKDPQVHIDGIGRIPLPLSAEHAESIIALSESGVVKPDAFRFENPLWEQRVLHVLVDEAVKGLGIDCKPDAVGVQLREMQLCNKDMSIEPPASIKMMPGAIGSLVVCLPSPHLGGDVHAKLPWAGKQLKSSVSQPSFVCWHRDITPETSAVSSGYRWTLVYDMKNFERPIYYSTAKLSAQMGSLHKDLEAWKRDHDRLKSRYVYVLQNNYTQEQLSLDVLSGGDLSLARTLKGVGQKSEFDVFLARIENRRTGHVAVAEYDNDSCDLGDCDLGDFHEMEDVLEESVSLESVFNLIGQRLVVNVRIEKEEVLQKDWEDDDEVTETDLHTYDDATATHVFRGTALVMMSHAEVSGFLMRNRCRPRAMLKHLGQQRADEAGDAGDPRATRAFKDSLLLMSADIKLHGDKSGNLESVIQTCISLKDASLFDSAALPLKKPLSPKVLSELSDWIWEAGFQSLQAGLEKLVPDDAVVFETHNFLQSLVGRQSSGQMQLRTGAESGLLNFIERKTNEVLDKAPRLFLEDATALADILKTTRSFEQTAERIEKALGRHTKNTPVILHFLDKVLSISEQLPPNFIAERFPRVFAQMTAHFSLRHDNEKLKKEAPEPKPVNAYWFLRTETGSTNSLWTKSPEQRHVPDADWHLLSRVIAKALVLNLENDVVPIFRILLDECNRVNSREAEHMLLPFMKFLPENMKENRLPAFAEYPRIREFYQAFVTAYFNRAVGKEPVLTWSREFARPLLKDKALFVEDCDHLNAFLQNSQFVLGRFPLAEYRRTKLRRYLPHGADCTWDTDKQECLIIRKRTWAWKLTREKWAENCKDFALDVKALGDFVDLAAVLRETYGNLVLHAERKANEPVVVADSDEEEVPPHKIYVWNGTKPAGAAPTWTQPQHFALPPLAGASQASWPLRPAAWNSLPPPDVPGAGTKRKAGENVVDTDMRPWKR